MQIKNVRYIVELVKLVSHNVTHVHTYTYKISYNGAPMLHS